ncbi:unnamed protein product [Amoebophrya sp. A25]|nr:unnamed protein product [Amoebophrya sp. A25]CAD7976896.1 unnamed protein product [Amoebophrya sp. A25]|eukprot:GSA25T00001350001.1
MTRTSPCSDPDKCCASAPFSFPPVSSKRHGYNNCTALKNFLKLNNRGHPPISFLKVNNYSPTVTRPQTHPTNSITVYTDSTKTSYLNLYKLSFQHPVNYVIFNVILSQSSSLYTLLVAIL